MLKFISWNVNGLRACYDKGFVDVFHRLEADFFCLQETKMQEGQLDAKFEGYHSYWNYAEKKGYSGTAIFSKVKPLSVTYGLGIEEHDHEGTVRNVIDFGVFVDIGVHQDGLVHISEITDKKFIKHPLEVVSVGDIVDVKVMSVDLKKKRIQLTMKGIS